MNDRDRLKQLRTLRDQLNRLPPSAERDRMLKEVGSRAVDVESSERRSATQAPLTPMPALADNPPEVAPDTPPAPRRATAKPRPQVKRAEPAPPRPVTAPAFIASVREAPELPEGQRLSLEDDITFAPDESRQIAPWTRGLRG